MLIREPRGEITMADAKHAYRWPEGALEYGASECSKSYSHSDEMQSLREEIKRLRELVIQLSKLAIRNVVNAK